ncbi:MAG: tRNA (N(6)-L-threonylcarbamoyladenosine(37)-C(2))-methylthiotransferase MtaB [Candidatus Latescibacterota bacterium]|nr:MAG: tRNA (N(6)-L-threonylcarbamoyladenosine(37)-C(2))-methylthiotransferase MtaB [Candidatus Latescibacterota bacterium]
MAYTFALETLGCRLNQAETAVFARQFVTRGYRLIEKSAAADLCIINTCTLTHQATSKCRRLIRSIIRRNPSVCIAAVGCYAQVAIDELKTIEGLDYIIGTADKMRLAEIITTPVKQPTPVVVTRRAAREHFTIDVPGLYTEHTRANLKVQEGCSFVCSFCIVPKSRGPARSRDFDDAIREARLLVAEGHREIVITGINVGTYNDRGRTLVDMVDALDTIDGLERVRLSSIEPTTIHKGLIDRMRQDGTLCPYLHIPVQSGDDSVLKRMRRRYTAAEFAKFINDVRSRVPNIGLGTDVIAGFPGEDGVAFEKTKQLIDGIPFANTHVFSFSARKGTGAYGEPDSVPGDVIAERSKILHRVGNAKKKEFYRDQYDALHRVLFEERDALGRWVGFSDNYVKVAVRTSDDLSNRLALVRVNGVSGPDAARRTPLVATGDLVDVEDAGVPLAGRADRDMMAERTRVEKQPPTGERSAGSGP